MLAYAFGSPNVMFGLTGQACYGPRLAAVCTVQGDYAVFDAGQWFPDRYDDPRYRVPECMIIWGYNIHATCPDNLFGHWIIDLMKRGTKIISIDPRLSWFASRAKYWLPTEAGTDPALAMGFLNVIIGEDLYDHRFLERWTNGAHLIRNDTGKLLRENDLVEGGSERNFVAWDPEAGRTVVWDSTKAAYRQKDGTPMISGECEVELTDGKKGEVPHGVGCLSVTRSPSTRRRSSKRLPESRPMIWSKRPGSTPGASRLRFTGEWPLT